MTIPGTAVHMDDVASQRDGIAYLRRTWITGSHAAVHAVRISGRWVWRVYSWPKTSTPATAPEQPKELAA